MLSQKLIEWYKINKRDLPWRDTKDPYKIWLSEIILQQTRVDQGKSYYLKFIDNYPTINDLANATENEVLNDWQGLGYYSRARNLHATAKHISENLGGIFPTTYDEIIKLKGVGPYTGAAIASIVFLEPKALVDGNVYRVLSRYFDISTPIDSTEGKKEFQGVADSTIPKKEPDVYNQAIMEFGALHCVPSNPDCNSCVLNDECQAFYNKTVAQRPVKSKKIKVRERHFYYGIFIENGKVILQKRLQSDIWQHLYEFPLLESPKALKEKEITKQFENLYQLKPTFISDEIKHILSHQQIITRFVHFLKIPKELASSAMKLSELEHTPLPRLIDKYLKDNKII